MLWDGMPFVWPTCDEGSNGGWENGGGCVGGGRGGGACTVHTHTCVLMCTNVPMYVHTCIEPYSKDKFTGPEHNNSVQSVLSHSISLIQ